MQGTQDIVLVSTSYCVAAAAMYVALDFGSRLAFFEKRRRALVAAALSAGVTTAAGSFLIDAPALADAAGLPTLLLTGLALATGVGLLFLNGKRTLKRRRMQRERARAARVLRLANYDRVTSLPNRGLFTEKLMHQLVSVHTFENTTAPLGLVYAELQGFDSLVEQHGEARLNRVLKTLATQLSQQLQAGDVLARLSREGLMLMVLEQDARSTRAALSAFCAQLSTPLVDEGESFRFTWGIGSSRYPDNGNSAQGLIRSALSIQQQIGAETATRTAAATPRYALAS